MQPAGYCIEPDITAEVAHLGCIGHQRNLMGAKLYAYMQYSNTRGCLSYPHTCLDHCGFSNFMGAGKWSRSCSYRLLSKSGYWTLPAGGGWCVHIGRAIYLKHTHPCTMTRLWVVA